MKQTLPTTTGRSVGAVILGLLTLGLAPLALAKTIITERVRVGTTESLTEGATYTIEFAGDGGAVYVYDVGTLVGTNVTFDSNKASMIEWGGGSGGAIYSSGKVVLTNVTFRNNKATGKGGGAIYNEGNLTILGGTFEGNSCESSYLSYGLGGGIINRGTLTMDNVTFKGNNATAVGWEDGGGAICITSGWVNLDGSVTLETETDTILLRTATMNWNLKEGKRGCLNGYDKFVNEGTLQITVDDAIAAPTNIVIATGDFSNVDGKDTFTITNATTGVSVDLTINGDFVLVGAVYYSLAVVADELLFAVTKAAKLSNVDIVDPTGVTNATATAYVNGTQVTANPDGSYTVPEGAPIKITYTVTENAIFGSCLKEKDLWLNDGITGDHAMTDAEKAPISDALKPAWVEGAAGRELALDTRERIVVATPGEVLPFAYSKNCWGAYPDANYVRIYTNNVATGRLFMSAYEDGYTEWFPQTGAYGKYDFSQKWSHMTTQGFPQPVDRGTNYATICYSTCFPLTIVQPVGGGTIAATTNGAAATGTFGVLGYEYINLTATPVMTATEHFELTRWYATTNGIAFDEGFTNLETTVTRFEMPLSEATIAANFQWKSNYTELVEIKTGESWKIFSGEKYMKGIDAKPGAIVTFRDSISPFTGLATLNLAAGATNIWDFTKNGRPQIADYAMINAQDGAVNMVLFDETLTNGVYDLALESGYKAAMKKFLISNETVTKECTICLKESFDLSPWVYFGAKRFKICAGYRDGCVNLIVEDGNFAVTYDAMGGAFTGGLGTNVVEVNVDKGYEFPATDPSRDNYTFDGWFRSWTNAAEKVKALDTSVSPVLPMEAHALYAKWTPVSVDPTTRDIAIPDILDEQPTLSIGEFAYAQASHPSQAFETLVTPLYLQTIGKGAFQGVTTLKTLIITPPRSYDDPSVPVSLTIGQKAFASCTSLEEIRIPGEVTFIDRTAFDNCAKLKRIIFTGTETIGYGAKAFYRCGYDNGEGELKVYMKQAFKDNNAQLLTDFKAWNTTVVITQLVDAFPTSGESATISDVSFGSLGADRKVAILVKVPMAIPNTKPDVSSVIVKHAATLGGSWTQLTPAFSEAAEDGTVLFEITMPEGNSGFLKVEIK